jgi:hypothetical protein
MPTGTGDLLNPSLVDIRSAVFSEDDIYRYSLRRTWNLKLSVVNFIGLNPSTADEIEDDPTIRRCVRFAKDWGHGGIVMTNLFSFRATKPRDLWREGGPVGPDNDTYLFDMASQSELIIAAWGSHSNAIKKRRVSEVIHLLRHWSIHHLGLSSGGHPRHPLCLKADTKPERWR